MSKILIIEDDWNFQAMMTVFLCENGFEVESADSAGLGIKKAMNSRPDLILLDYNLGDMTGQEAAFWLEYMNRTRRIPVILLSAMGNDPKIAADFRRYAACKCVLSKDRPLPEILGEINSALAGRL